MRITIPETPSAPPSRLSRDTDLRASGSNALGVDNDHDAVAVWLKAISLKSPHTVEAYRRDVERYLMWVTERGQRLSTITVEDAIEHVHFLRDPPAHWINPRVVPRSDPTWRPMHGPLSASSAQRALVAIGGMYRFLNRHGYLSGDPFYGIGAALRGHGGAGHMDTNRAFSAEHLAAIRASLKAMAPGPSQRRLRAILMLAETTGLRRHELCSHTWGNLHELADVASGDGSAAAGVGRYLAVLGKGGVKRDVPVRDSVVEALREHLADRKRLEEQGVLPALALDRTPLLNAFRPGALGSGALTDNALHLVLKRFFARVARDLDRRTDARAGVLRSTFERASCHWLRHTFAHQVLRATGQDLPVTQQLLGHKSVATTGIYVKADLGQRVTAVAALPDQFA